MEVVLFVTLIVVVSLSIRLLQETIARKNAVDSLDRVNKSLGDLIVEHTAVRNERDEAISERNDAVDQREKAKKERDEANQTIANMMGDISIVRMERQGVIEELEKITKERDELQAKLCKIKDNDIELLNLKIYKERVLARLKSIIDDEVDESFHS